MTIDLSTLRKGDLLVVDVDGIETRCRVMYTPGLDDDEPTACVEAECGWCRNVPPADIIRRVTLRDLTPEDTMPVVRAIVTWYKLVVDWTALAYALTKPLSYHAAEAWMLGCDLEAANA